MTADGAPRIMDATVLADVERRLHALVAVERLHAGTALAVFQHGRRVLDLTAGWADAQQGEPMRADTLFPLLSAGKPFASVALLQLLERGALRLDDPVARYWPAFAQHGKGAVTIRCLLTHRGGFPDTPPALGSEGWGDAATIGRAMEALRPTFPPGTTTAYHHLTQQWVIAELVRRLDGRPFADYVRDEITGPLDLDEIVIGLPPKLESRVARLHATEDTDDGGVFLARQFNRPAVHQAPFPVCAVASARDLARFYAALTAGGALDGARVLREATLREALAIAVDDQRDRTLQEPARWGLGFQLGGANVEMGTTSTIHTFGHGGGRTVSAWGDRDLGVAMALMVTGVRTDPTPRRRLIDAVRAGCRPTASAA